MPTHALKISRSLAPSILLIVALLPVFTAVAATPSNTQGMGTAIGGSGIGPSPAVSGKSFKGVVGVVIDIINKIIPVLATLAVVLFMVSGLRYVRSAGSAKNNSREALVWGLIALFVLFSIWGILRVLKETLLN